MSELQSATQGRQDDKAEQPTVVTRRRMLCGISGLALAGALPGWARSGPAIEQERSVFTRVRPGDAGWPSKTQWASLEAQVGGRLEPVRSPFDTCRSGASAECTTLFHKLRNPYFIGENVALTQTLGWVDAWTSRPSAYAIAAQSADDMAAGIDFARAHRLRLVVKGGGHSYQGGSNAPDSLLLWTKRLDSIELHDQFVGKGCDGKVAPAPAVSVGSGAIWMHVYDAVTTQAGRYVQGGGCATVGVAGLIQSGGFGSFSKRYGTACASLLEAEIVTADGVTRVVNECNDPDLFWALKGGGGGSFGVVTRVTLQTHKLPGHFGAILGTIKATSDAACRSLIALTMQFYRDALHNPNWGEQIIFSPGNKLSLQMVFQGLDEGEARAIWKPYFDHLKERPDDYRFEEPVVMAVPARHFWDPEVIESVPDITRRDDRADAPRDNIFWAGDAAQVGQVLNAYHSAWLPASLLDADEQPDLIEALFRASRTWDVSLHFNKGLSGAPSEARAAAARTAMNPAVIDAFALAIVAGTQGPAYPGVPGHEPKTGAGRQEAKEIRNAFSHLSRLVNSPASYLPESDYFDRDWQAAYWGSNHPRLATIKQRYDPDGLFFVHHGIASEDWSEDGFVRHRRSGR